MFIFLLISFWSDARKDVYCPQLHFTSYAYPSEVLSLLAISLRIYDLGSLEQISHLTHRSSTFPGLGPNAGSN